MMNSKANQWTLSMSQDRDLLTAIGSAQLTPARAQGIGFSLESTKCECGAQIDDTGHRLWEFKLHKDLTDKAYTAWSAASRAVEAQTSDHKVLKERLLWPPARYHPEPEGKAVA